MFLLLDDIQMAFQKRKPAQFVKYQSQKAGTVPSVSENSDRVDLAPSWIGLPVIEQRAWATLIKAKRGEM